MAQAIFFLLNYNNMHQDIQNIELTYLTKEDYPEFKEAMITSYPSMPNSHWKEPQIETLLKKFPEGQVVIKVNNKIVGGALSIIVDYGKLSATYLQTNYWSIYF